MRPEIVDSAKNSATRLPAEPNFLRNSVYVHELNKLLAAAGLEKALDMAVANNPALKANWALVKDWTIESRYVLAGLSADALYRAVTGRNGVLRWLRQHW